MPIRESSDQVQKVEDRSLGFSIYEGTATISGPLTALSTGYSGSTTISLSDLNLGVQIPEVSAVLQSAASIGGGVTRVSYQTLPFTRWNTNGTIEEAAYLEVYYDYVSSPGTPNASSSFFKIYYFNRTSTSGVSLEYKIKGSDAANSDSAYRRTQ